MEKENNKKKINPKLIILVVFGVIIFFSLGTTVAYFAWNSTSAGKDATLTISSVNKSNTVCRKISDDNHDLFPVATKEEGRVVRINTKQTLSEYAYVTWTLTVDSIDNALKDATFKYELVNSTTGVSYGSGNFSGKSAGDTITLSNNTENLEYDQNYTFTLYIWIDGTMGDNPFAMTEKAYSFSLVCNVTGEGTNKVQDPASDNPNAAEYITNLYLDNKDGTVGYGGVSLAVASEEGLINDRYGINAQAGSGGASNDEDFGNIRYYGEDPPNYVWLGDYYTSDMTFARGLGDYGGDLESCMQYEESSVYCQVDLKVHSGEKKLWRIIGIFDGRLKLISEVPISTQHLSWDTSANATGGNSGYGINQWGPSGSYEGADLMRLLNPGYSGTNGSLYWNKTSGTVYTGRSNATTSGISFANTGLTANEKSMIDTATWYLGASNTNGNYAYQQYQQEKQGTTLGKICSSGTHCNDTVTRTSTWNGKVGLMYPSDLGYAGDLNYCGGYTLSNYYNDDCATTNWLALGIWEWTISPHAYSSYAYDVFYVDYGGGLYDISASHDGCVRPAVYLKSGVTISEGSGSQSDPYVLELE